jgi:DNA-binding NtrC family response regulator
MHAAIQFNTQVTTVPKVLIFDENVGDLARHAEPFESRGFEVHRCTSYESALRSIEREDFDLALVDQGSRAFEGRRIIGHLIRYNPRAAFVVLARCTDMNCYLHSLELGALDYFEKPVSQTQLHSIIESYLTGLTSGR